MRYAPLAVAVALTVGIAIGFVLGQGGTAHCAGPRPPSPPRADSEAPAKATEGVEMVRVSSLGRVKDGVRDAAGGERGLTAQEREEVRRAAAEGRARVSAAGPAEAPEWTGTSTGTVVDELGVPLVNATVVTHAASIGNGSRLAARSTSDIGQDYDASFDLEEELESYAIWRTERRERLRTCVTDEDGRFTLAGLKLGTCSLQAYSSGFFFEPKVAEPGESVRIIGEPIGAFELDVRLPDGSQPEEAIVLLVEGEAQQVAGTWTPEEPVVRFLSEDVRLVVLHGDARRLSWRGCLADYESEPLALDLDEDGGGPHLVQLRARRQLRVTVIDESIVPSGLETWVKATRLGEAQPKAETLERFNGGPFLLGDLPPGDYTITAGRGGSVAEAEEQVTVGEGRTDLEITLGELNLDRVVVAHCSGPDGEPLAGIKFEYRATRTGSSRDYTRAGVQVRHRGGLAVASDRLGGEYWVDLQGMTEGAEQLASLSLTAKSPKYGDLQMEVDLATKSVAFSFQEAARVQVEVSGADPSGLTVSLVPVEQAEAHREDLIHARAYSGTVAGNGRADLGKVQPGEFDLMLRKSAGPGASGLVLAKTRVQVRPGEQTLSIDAPILGEVVIHAPGFDVGTMVQLYPRGLTPGSARSGAVVSLSREHRARFGEVRPGEYVVIALTDKGPQQMSFTAPCGELLFESDTINAFEVVGLTPGKAAERAGLRIGDMVLGFDDQLVRGQDFEARLGVALVDGPCKVLILRGGREMTLGIEQAKEGTRGYVHLGAHLMAREVSGR